ncbi:DUF4142 domain-containing protein [Myroides sp. LJL119]
MKIYIKMLFIATLVLGICSGCKQSTAKDPEKMAKEQNRANLPQNQDDQLNPFSDHKSPQAKQNSDILVEVVNSQLYEIELAKVAKRKTSSAKVKEYADQLEKQHTSRLGKLNSLAKDHNYVVPSNLSAMDWENIQDLENTPTNKFDKQWIDIIIKKHNKAVDVLLTGIQETDQSSIKGELNNTLLETRKHLESANELKMNYIK